MKIDFKKNGNKVVNGFKGGQGDFITSLFDDGAVKIMRNTIPSGSTIGLHTHEGNCEVMFVTKGEITFSYDGVEETVGAGEAHYCPNGHSHMAMNRTDTDAEFLAVVPTMAK